MDKQKRQKQIEENAIYEGVLRYRKLFVEQPLSTSVPGQELIGRNISALASAIYLVQTNLAKEDCKLKGRHKWGIPLLSLDADHWAVIVLITVFNETHDPSVRNLALKVSDLGFTEVKWGRLRKSNPDLIKFLSQFTKSYDLKRVTRILRKNKQFEDRWPKDTRVHLGMLLIQCLLESTSLFILSQKPKNKGYENYLEFTEDAWEFIQTKNEEAEWWHPVLPPMIVEPRQWTLGPSSSAYLSIELPLIKRASGTSRVIHETAECLRSLNHIQKTRYRINRKLYEVVSAIWDSGGIIGDLPPRNNLPLPPVPVNIDTNEEAKALWKAKARGIHDQNHRLTSRRKAMYLKLHLTKQYLDEPEFYLPCNFCFRGRVYYLTNHLHPQTEDSTRCLLEFAEGLPMTPSAQRWLKIHLANCWGNDKVSFDDRIQWVKDNEQYILKCADEPLDYLWWADADKPFLFLAACVDYAEGCRTSWTNLSHLPVSIDGTCNGLQHYAALLRDPVAAKAVNLTTTEAPTDIYTDILEVVADFIQSDCESEDENIRDIALRWQPELSRKVVKRAVMTYPYGVTPYGISEQLVNDGHCDNLSGNPSHNANYLMVKIWQAIPLIISSAAEAMGWLQEAAGTLAQHQLPFSWSTPSDFLVVQEYLNVKPRRISTVLQTVQVIIDSYNDPLHGRKQRAAAPPNYIHSLDAAHLSAVVMAGAKHYGITDFMAIHDSYGVHAYHVEGLSRITKEEFVKLHSKPLLQELKNDLERNYGIPLPAAPVPGDFNIKKVLESPYFFS